MADNIINAVFGSGICAVTTSAFRANYGMILRFSGIELPTAFECDFSNYDTSNKDSVTAIGQNNEVQIPDDLWDSGLNIYAYVYLHPTDDSGVTVYTVTIPVLGRPNRTEETPTPHEQTVIEQAISALNEAVEQTAADVASADASATAAALSEANAESSERAAAASASAALASQNAAESAAQGATESASGAAESARNAALSASQAAESATAAQASAEQAERSVQSISDDVERAERAAQTATEKATEAAQSAQSAASAAQNAASSATSAQSSANDAEQAKQDAQDAKQAAETAQAAAEQAAESVSESAAQIVTKASVTLPSKTANAYWNISGTTAVFTTFTGGWSAYDPIAVQPGDLMTVKSSQGPSNNVRAWVVTDDDLNIISMSENYYGRGALETLFQIPADGTKLLITDYGNDASVYKISYPPASFVANPFTDFALFPRKFWNVETDKAVLTDIASTWVASSPIPVMPGDRFIVSSNQYLTHKTRIWIATDDDLNIVAMAADHYRQGVYAEVVTIPAGASKLLICGVDSTSFPIIVFKYGDYHRETEKPLYGKRLSLLGDSISAYVGTIPSGNTPYYNGTNSGVWLPSQMWWSVLCDKTGMIPCVINAWSGSGVTQLEDAQHSSITPMSADARCSALDDDNGEPDVIIIAGGVNDYTYAQSAQSEPLDWDGTTAPTEGASFTETYACMIKKLQRNYPKAVIVALSTWFTMRGTDNGYTLTHAVGSNTYTQQDYNDKIRYVAEQMHIPYIDVSNIGFNRNNFYPLYAIDSSTIPTHPASSGQYVMGVAIAEKLIALTKGFVSA